MLIYKVLHSGEWAAFRAASVTDGAPVDLADGFIHFSTAAQLPGTLARHFAGAEDLTLLACDGTAMGDALKWEVSRGGDLFPHLYRNLKMTEILWDRPIGWDGSTHILPDGVE